MSDLRRITTLNLPFGISYLVNTMLADRRCTSDHILLTADCLDQMIKDLPAGSHFIPAIQVSIDQLREWAPGYAIPPGKPFGDFDGTLTA